MVPLPSFNSSLSFAGDSSHTTVLWKQGERVITAGDVKVRKDGRLSMAEASSLKISGVGVADTGEERATLFVIVAQVQGAAGGLLFARF